MSTEKYPSQMEAIVLFILQIIFATRAALKIGGSSQIVTSFSWEVFSHMLCLDQSRVSENI